MSFLKNLPLAVLFLFFLVIACSEVVNETRDASCDVEGAFECLEAARPNADHRICTDGVWVEARCAEPKICRDNACALVAGVCAETSHRCLDAKTVELCVASEMPKTKTCGEGLVCESGACVATELCIKTASQCLDLRTAEICVQDAMAKVEVCADGFHCELGACVVGKVCSETSKQCIDLKTIENCTASEVAKYDVCGEGLVCESGGCVAGNVCEETRNICLDLRTAEICVQDAMAEIEICADGFHCELGVCVGTLTEREQFIKTYSEVTDNLIKDPKFRKGANWDIIRSSVLRENGIVSIHGHTGYDNERIQQVIPTEPGQEYIYSLAIETEDVNAHDGELDAGATFSFSNSDHDSSKVRVLGTRPKTVYTGSFVANAETTVFRMDKYKTKSGRIHYSEPTLKKAGQNPGFSFHELSEVEFEAKQLFPLNADYGLPESLPERTYTVSNGLSYSNKDNLIIEGLDFEHNLIGANSNTAISLMNCTNVTIRNCRFKNIVLGYSIAVEGGHNITVEDCEFENIRHGAYFAAVKGGIVFQRNHVKNLVGAMFGGPWQSNAVQLNGCKGPNTKIKDNSVVNILGESSCEDIINIFNSSGTPESWIEITGNWLVGGGPIDIHAPSHTGGAVTMGDWGGQYILCDKNYAVNTGSAGMGIGGGQHISITDNVCFGTQRTYAKSAFILYNWTPNPPDHPTNPGTGLSSDLILQGNTANWRHGNGRASAWDISSGIRDIIPNLETDAIVTDFDLSERIIPPNPFVRFKQE